MTLFKTLVVSLAVAWGGQPLTSIAAQGSGPSAMDAVPATKVVIFHPAGSSGQVVQGNCAMGESIALDRSDAWRCIVGNVIYDPCFSAAPHATSVICDATPMKPVGFTVKLSAPLPTHRPAKGLQAWLLKLGDGTICGFDTGATGGVGGQRLNYDCANHNFVLGNPEAQGKVWYAVEVKLSNKTNSSGFIPSNIFAISIATIWK
jgi:hypothetical protein